MTDRHRNSARYRTCRRCQSQTWDYDAELDDWWCDECDSWADI